MNLTLCSRSCKALGVAELLFPTSCQVYFPSGAPRNRILAVNKHLCCCSSQSNGHRAKRQRRTPLSWLGISLFNFSGAPPTTPIPGLGKFPCWVLAAPLSQPLGCIFFFFLAFYEAKHGQRTGIGCRECLWKGLLQICLSGLSSPGEPGQGSAESQPGLLKGL